MNRRSVHALSSAQVSDRAASATAGLTCLSLWPTIHAVAQSAHRLTTFVNYGEAVYITERERGLTAAQHLIAIVDQMPIIVVEADRKLTFAVAHLMAHYAIAHADAFALALAQKRQAVLLTGDPEFRQAESLVTIEWLPQA